MGSNYCSNESFFSVFSCCFVPNLQCQQKIQHLATEKGQFCSPIKQLSPEEGKLIMNLFYLGNKLSLCR